MRMINLQNFIKDRKILYIILCLVLICVFTLTIAYSSLNAILEITGSAEVNAADWDIRLANPKVKEGSVNSNLPTITSNKEASFSVTLNNPGDFYDFSIDVVNNGTIDAMIDSIEKISALTEEQAKFMNYIIEYENGNTISTKQLVQANSFVRLKVKVEYRKDISNTDLPISQNVLDLSFKLVYVQSDEEGTIIVPDNGVKKVASVVSGDGTKTSDEICIGEECFYVISSTEEEIKMLAKYNLLVGNKYDNTNGAVKLENLSGIQDKKAIGWFSSCSVDNPMIGTKPFSSTNYWSSTTSAYPAYVYNENSYLYEYVENYKIYLEELGVEVNEARLITIEELEGLGCVRSSNNCIGVPEWVYSTTYWSGSAHSSRDLWGVYSNSAFRYYDYASHNYGVRPVIVISKNYI